MTRILALIPPATVEEVDAFQKRHGIPTQAEAIRRLLRNALDADKPKKRATLAPDEAAALVVLEKLRKRIGAADASEAMEKLWRLIINWEKEQETPEPTPPPAPAPARQGILGRIPGVRRKQQ